MSLLMRAPQATDLAAIMRIERAGFTPDEAASEESMAERIKVIPDTFIVAEKDGQLAGYIVGPAIGVRYLTDDLFAHLTPNAAADKALSVLSLAVDPDLRGQGVGGKLLTAFAARAKEQGRELISLTCLNRLVPYYVEHGYVNEGMAASTHAGEIWYNMILKVQ
ncbi:GNAT family N-acetyltransferase [Lacticaseibacillus zhaodongensis]|uniref:GNAT family N-acetyltransferase n=1 Tax=Lacticaseibacillus zhaodongensis TaxID=2668065 RepID=UPI0012D2AA65|nr:GNAT family N-acetyltransferase [Lacticaseibacillus zhaodongensis]